MLVAQGSGENRKRYAGRACRCGNRCSLTMKWWTSSEIMDMKELSNIRNKMVLLVQVVRAQHMQS